MQKASGTSLVIITLCLVALWYLSPLFRKIVFSSVIGKPNLHIQDLPAIFNGNQSFTIEKNPHKKLPSADRSVQAYNETVSIIYHTTTHDLGFSETVDIAHPGKFGMIFTMVNGRVTVFERIGGLTRANPTFTDEETRALDRFMTGLRNCFKQA